MSLASRYDVSFAVAFVFSCEESFFCDAAIRVMGLDIFRRAEEVPSKEDEDWVPKGFPSSSFITGSFSYTSAPSLNAALAFIGSSLVSLLIFPGSIFCQE